MEHVASDNDARVYKIDVTFRMAMAATLERALLALGIRNRGPFRRLKLAGTWA